MTDIEKLLHGNYDEHERDAETYAFLNGDVTIGSISIPPVVAGIMPLLEIAHCPFLFGVLPSEIDLKSLILTTYIIRRRELALLDANTTDEAAIITEKNRIEVATLISGIFRHALAGFALIPDSKNSEKPDNQRMYDAEWLTSLVAVGARISNRTDFDILWRVPLTAVGFYFAQYLRENGVKGIGRQLDVKAAMDYIKSKRESVSTK